jgi:hypothetical protein
MGSDEVFTSMIRNAKDALTEAELEVIRKRNWLSGLEAEFEEAKRRKVTEGAGDTRTLLNG